MAKLKMSQEIFDLIYPVGCIYMSVNSINPKTLFGGTWTAWGSGRVPVGINTSDTDFNTVEKTGGEKTHKLTVSELAAHNHSPNKSNYGFNIYQENNGDVARWQVASGTSFHAIASKVPDTDGVNYSTTTANTGGGTAHNNLSPYIVCYMWKRTA